MLDNIKKDKRAITFGVLSIFVGILLLSANYLQAKKDKAFETINFDLFEEEEEQSQELATTRGKKENQLATGNYEIYYIGYIEIPKIDLKKGFVDKDSWQNNVEQNVTIVEPSTYPDVDKGNFILAAHSGNGYIGYFKNLYKLKKKDVVYIEYKKRKYTYRITKIYEQPKTGKIKIYRSPNKTSLTLVTCTKDNDDSQTIYIAEQITKK